MRPRPWVLLAVTLMLLPACGKDDTAARLAEAEQRIAEPEQELLAFPNSRNDDQADTFACAALQTTRRADIDQAALAEAMDDPTLTQVSPWKTWHS